MPRIIPSSNRIGTVSNITVSNPHNSKPRPVNPVKEMKPIKPRINIDFKEISARKKPTEQRFKEFIQKQKDVKRKPVRHDKKSMEKMRGNLSNKRNRSIAIREAASRKVSVIISYTKRTGETKNYEVNVYSFRFKKLRNGVTKVLYAQDKDDNRHRSIAIKNFIVKRINNVVLTDRKFRPVWPIEIEVK